MNVLDRCIEGRNCRIFTHGKNGTSLYWPAGGLDQAEEVAQLLRSMTADHAWQLIAFETEDWNAALSPWPAPAVFGKEPFAGEAPSTLRWLAEACIPAVEACQPHDQIIGGYSLAGLFSLWAFYESGLFQGAVSCSGSLWYPGWESYLQNRHAFGRVYLSLGDREEKTRNRTMAEVGNATRRMDALLAMDDQIDEHTLVWHPGGHFDNVQRRIAQGFAWAVQK